MAGRSIRIVCKIARLVDLNFGVKHKTKEQINKKYSLWSYLVVKNTTNIKISASQSISIKDLLLAKFI